MRVYKNQKIQTGKRLNYRLLTLAFVAATGVVLSGIAAYLSVSADEGDKVTTIDSSNFRDYMSAYGNANIPAEGDLITVAPLAVNQQGAVYFNERIDVSQSFNVRLTVNIQRGTTPADGMAFGFTESPIGTHQAHSGLYVVADTVALIFDTYRNTPAGQPAEPPVPNATVRYTGAGGSPAGYYDKDGNPIGELTVSGTETALNETAFFAPFDLEMDYDPDTGMITYTFLGHTLETPLGDMGADNGLAFIVQASTGQHYSGHRIEVQEIQATLLTQDPDSVNVQQDPDTGVVTIMPTLNDNPYPSGTLIHVDGVGTFPVDASGTATIPKEQLAEYDAERAIIVEETDKNPSSETTVFIPGYRTSPPPAIDTTKNSDGSRTIIPLKEDDSRYPAGTIVTIPDIGEVTLNADGEATIPVGDVPGFDETKSVTVTEPGKDASPNVEFVLPGSTTTAPDSPTAAKDEDGNGVIHPTRPDGSSYPPGTIVEIVDVGEYPVDEDGNITIPAEDMPTYDTDTSIIIHEDGKEPSEGVPIAIPGNTTIDPGDVSVTRNEDGSLTIVPTKPGGGTYPEGTTIDIDGIGEVVLDENGVGIIPAEDVPQYDTNAPATITEDDKAPSGEFTVPVAGYQTASPTTITVENNSDGSATVSVTKPDGSPYPAGTIVSIPGVGDVELDANGEGTIPAGQVPTTDTTAEATVREAGKDASDVVSVLIPGSTTVDPGQVTIDKTPDGSGAVTVTRSDGSLYPAGTVATIEGIGEVILNANGEGVIPEDQMPTYDTTASVTIQEGDKLSSQAVNVSIEGSKTIAPAEVVASRNSDGTTIIRPLKPDSSTYPAGTVVTIEGIGDVTLDANGSATLPADVAPQFDETRQITIHEVGKDSSDEMPFTLLGHTTSDPSRIDVINNPDGSITIIPINADGSRYPEGTTVTIPGIGDITLNANGEGLIPAGDVPQFDTTLRVTVQEPNRNASNEVDLQFQGLGDPASQISDGDGEDTLADTGVSLYLALGGGIALLLGGVSLMIFRKRLDRA